MSSTPFVSAFAAVNRPAPSTAAQQPTTSAQPQQQSQSQQQPLRYRHQPYASASSSSGASASAAAASSSSSCKYVYPAPTFAGPYLQQNGAQLPPIPPSLQHSTPASSPPSAAHSGATRTAFGSTANTNSASGTTATNTDSSAAASTLGTRVIARGLAARGVHVLVEHHDSSVPDAEVGGSDGQMRGGCAPSRHGVYAQRCGPSQFSRWRRSHPSYSAAGQQQQQHSSGPFGGSGAVEEGPHDREYDCAPSGYMRAEGPSTYPAEGPIHPNRRRYEHVAGGDYYGVLGGGAQCADNAYDGEGNFRDTSGCPPPPYPERAPAHPYRVTEDITSPAAASFYQRQNFYQQQQISRLQHQLRSLRSQHRQYAGPTHGYVGMPNSGAYQHEGAFSAPHSFAEAPHDYGMCTVDGREGHSGGFVYAPNRGCDSGSRSSLPPSPAFSEAALSEGRCEGAVSGGSSERQPTPPLVGGRAVVVCTGEAKDLRAASSPQSAAGVTTAQSATDGGLTTASHSRSVSTAHVPATASSAPQQRPTSPQGPPSPAPSSSVQSVRTRAEVASATADEAPTATIRTFSVGAEDAFPLPPFTVTETAVAGDSTGAVSRFAHFAASSPSAPSVAVPFYPYEALPQCTPPYAAILQQCDERRERAAAEAEEKARRLETSPALATAGTGGRRGVAGRLPRQPISAIYVTPTPPSSPPPASASASEAPPSSPSLQLTRRPLSDYSEAELKALPDLDMRPFLASPDTCVKVGGVVDSANPATLASLLASAFGITVLGAAKKGTGLFVVALADFKNDYPLLKAMDERLWMGPSAAFVAPCAASHSFLEGQLEGLRAIENRVSFPRHAMTFVPWVPAATLGRGVGAASSARAALLSSQAPQRGGRLGASTPQQAAPLPVVGPVTVAAGTRVGSGASTPQAKSPQPAQMVPESRVAYSSVTAGGASFSASSFLAALAGTRPTAPRSSPAAATYPLLAQPACGGASAVVSSSARRVLSASG